MKIQVFSDLHLECKNIKYPIPITKYLILAGDICEIDKLVEHRAFFMYINSKWERVIWVPGNHEYYSKIYNMDEIDDKIISFIKLFPNIKLLNREFIDIEGIRFMGCTLWSHISDSVTHICHNAFGKLRYNNKCINNLYYNKQHDRDKRWIIDNYDDSLNTVLITHFPIKQDFTTNPIFNDDTQEIKNIYTNNLNLTCRKDNFLYCISGHTHYNFYKKKENITYLSNQYGYETKSESNYKDDGVFVIQ